METAETFKHTYETINMKASMVKVKIPQHLHYHDIQSEKKLKDIDISEYKSERKASWLRSD